jgi:lactoylglutathione lyase
MKLIKLIILSAVVLAQSGLASGQDIKNDSTMHEKILGLRTCIYMVPDLAAAKKWYTEAFHTQPYFDEPFYVGFNIGGFELGLLPEEKETTGEPDNIRTYWGVDDIRQTFDAFLALGATVHEEPHSVGEPLEVATVRDPWGNLIGLIHNPVFRIEE